MTIENNRKFQKHWKKFEDVIPCRNILMYDATERVFENKTAGVFVEKVLRT